MTWNVSDYVEIYAIIEDREHVFYGRILQVRQTALRQECLFELLDTTCAQEYSKTLVPQWWVDSKDLYTWTRS